jgi:hypothetical protein
LGKQSGKTAFLHVVGTYTPNLAARRGNNMLSFQRLGRVSRATQWESRQAAGLEAEGGRRLMDFPKLPHFNPLARDR